MRSRKKSMSLGLAALLGASLVGVVPAAQAEDPVGSQLVAETFMGDSVVDDRWAGLGDACLTAASKRDAAPNAGDRVLAGCWKTAGTDHLTGKTGGYLQLTDDSRSSPATVLYDRPIPSRAGLDISFYQFQIGQGGGSRADGIGFFLSDGAYTLATPGPAGGALGYASMNNQAGLRNGVLGIGLDQFGNFSRQPYVGVGCEASSNWSPRSIAIREGEANKYCLASDTSGRLAVKAVESLETPSVQAGPTPADPAGAQWKLVRIHVSPTNEQNPTATVTVSLNDVVVLTVPLKTPLPPLVKIGFSSSTGGFSQPHLVRQLDVRTVRPLGAIGLVKTVDHTDDTGTPKKKFSIGDTIPFSFEATNSGSDVLTNVKVTDVTFPELAVTCPTDRLAPADSMRCTGSHAVTAADLAEDGAVKSAKDLLNEAKVTAETEQDKTQVTASSQVKVPLFTGSVSWSKRDQFGEVVSPTTWTLTGPNGYAQTITDNQPGDVNAADGEFTVGGLAPGQYSIVETQAPAGYTGRADAVDFPAVTEANPDVVLSNPLVNTKQLGSVSWSKVDAESAQLLAKSEWSLTGPDGKSVTVVDNADGDVDTAEGKLEIEGLAWGAYTLKELKAPEGYVLSTDEYAFTVDGSALVAELSAITNDKKPTPPEPGPGPGPEPGPGPGPAPEPDPTVTPTAPTATPSHGSGLAVTGADVPLAAVSAGVIFLLAGLVIIAGARRKRLS